MESQEQKDKKKTQMKQIKRDLWHVVHFHRSKFNGAQLCILSTHTSLESAQLSLPNDREFLDGRWSEKDEYIIVHGGEKTQIERFLL